MDGGSGPGAPTEGEGSAQPRSPSGQGTPRLLAHGGPLSPPSCLVSQAHGQNLTESRKRTVCSLVVPKSGVWLSGAGLVALSLLPSGVASRDSGSQSRSGSICGCLSRL